MQDTPIPEVGSEFINVKLRTGASAPMATLPARARAEGKALDATGPVAHCCRNEIKHFLRVATSQVSGETSAIAAILTSGR